MSIVKQSLVGASGQGAGGYTIESSLRFRKSASTYLNRTFSSVGNRTTWTWSAWVKRSLFPDTTALWSSNTTSDMLYIAYNGNLTFYPGTSTKYVRSTALLRDPSAWYHVMVVWDTTNATDSERALLYINGVKQTSANGGQWPNGYPALNTTTGFNNSAAHGIGVGIWNLASKSDGYMTEIHFVDGQALTADDFGEFDEDTGVWKPKQYTGTYGTNGFYLENGRGTDQSGNGNNWTENNFNTSTSSATTYDVMTDVPTLTDGDAANYCTWNPVDIYSTSYIPTYSDGNLKVYHGTRTYAWSTLGMSEGKWYAEIELDTHGSGIPTIGIALRDSGGTLKYTTYASNGNKIVNGTSTSYGSTYTAGDIIGIAFDADTGAVTFYKNNVSQGSISNSDLASNVTARVFSGHSGSLAAGATWILNAGQQPFAYTPPTGFLPMNTYNLPDATIEDGSEYFNTLLYTGDGTTSRSITGVGFQPDFVWGKERNGVSHHVLVDAVRGLSTGGRLSSNRTNAEDNLSNATLDSFDSDGFTTGSSANIFNTSGRTFAAWNWKCNGSGVGNTDGSVNSTVSVNTTSGVSIVSFNAGAAGNQTVGHGLGVTPEMIIMKDRDSSGYGNFLVFHSSVCTSTSNYLLITGTGALGSVTNSWGSALPTSTVFGFGSNVNVAANDNIIAYCFAGVEGFSAFKTYTGNGSTDGPFVYTGFRPSWVMVKSSSYASTNWLIFDNKRNTYNPVELELNANNTNQEYDNGRDIDFLSNGFKIRSGSNNNFNTSGGTYIYAAFAENPFKYALAR